MCLAPSARSRLSLTASCDQWSHANKRLLMKGGRKWKQASRRPIWPDDHMIFNATIPCCLPDCTAQVPSGCIPPGTDGWGCNCWNGTEPCDVAQSCFWFSQGCTIGCKTCDGGPSNPNTKDRCGSGMNATNNLPQHRTFNRDIPALTPEDVYRWNPWRAPGNAPVSSMHLTRAQPCLHRPNFNTSHRPSCSRQPFCTVVCDCSRALERGATID